MKHRVLFAVCMSFVLSSIMSAWVTWINLGWSESFYLQWGHAFILAWPAAAVIALFSAPEIHKVVTWIVNQTDKGHEHHD